MIQKNGNCRNNPRISHDFFLSITACSRPFNMKLNVLLFAVSLLFYDFNSARGSNLPDPKFIADVVNYLNRLGTVYHLPPMRQSAIFKYRKLIDQYR